MTAHSGSCLCGAVKFRINGAFEGFFLCHCSRCRQSSGSAHASNLFSPDGTIDWVSGRENVKVYRLPDTRFGKSFCSTCGCALPRESASGTGLVVPAGCLTTPVAMKPNAHIFTASRADWDHDLETVPSFDELP
ncbi:GFA family protein [uncultured Roseibium sp.]|uniref:GFA family protein n=1 Tax=uncultured Roseibium sp. TaxID=1936171 RepID=UPI00261978FF|nr:GFA family protein [uncultured Roseibium sp.]